MTEDLNTAPLLHRSSAFRRIIEACLDAGASSDPLLITGESGTGKSRLATFTHKMGRRREKPVVQWSAGNSLRAEPLPELLGVVKGAFPCADKTLPGLIVPACGGTFVVDHVDLLPLPSQHAILHLLRTGTVQPVGARRAGRVDVRLICTTNCDLGDLVSRGEFLSELANRLLANTLEIPPIRERREDIMPLFTYLMQKGSRMFRRSPPALRSDHTAFLEGLRWPGNAFDVQNMASNLFVRVRTGDVLMDRFKELARDLHL